MIAGFLMKVSENIQNPLFLDQISAIGLLVHFEGLITAHGMLAIKFIKKI